MTLADGALTRGICAGLVLLGLCRPAVSGEFSEDWRIDTQVGHLWPVGRIRRTFGAGFLAGWTVGRRVFADVIVEGGVRLGSMSYGGARTVTGTTCLPGARGLPVCTTGPTTQRGGSTDVLLGATVPLKTDRHGRALEIGTGVVFESYSVSPGGESPGSRHGAGVFGKLAAELFPVRTLGGISLLLTGRRISTRGGRLGTSLPTRTSDTWLDASLLLQAGRGRRGGP